MKRLTPGEAHRLHAAMIEDLEARGWARNVSRIEEEDDPNPYPPGQLPRSPQPQPDPEREEAEALRAIWWSLTPHEREAIIRERKLKRK